MKIFKLYYIDECTKPGDVFDDIEIMDEDQFRERFWQAVDEGQINDESIEEEGINEQTDRDTYPTKEMVRIFSEDGYECEIIII